MMPGVTFRGNGLTCESAFCVNMNMAVLFKPSMDCKGDNVDFFLPISSFIGVTGCSDMVVFFFSLSRRMAHLWPNTATFGCLRT